MNEIKRLEEHLYKLAFNKTLIMLQNNKMIPWPLSYGYERAYLEFQEYFIDTKKTIHALEKLGQKEEYYFILREKTKTKKMC